MTFTRSVPNSVHEHAHIQTHTYTHTQAHTHTHIHNTHIHPHPRAGALWHQEGAGRIAVLGSVQLFDDKYIDKEENSKLVDFIFKWLKPVRYWTNELYSCPACLTCSVNCAKKHQCCKYVGNVQH